MFVSQPQRFSYRSNLSAEAIHASADRFIAQQGGPLHPHTYSASWLSASVLEVAPLVALGGLRFSGKQRATLELGAAVTGTPATLTVYPAASMQPMFWGITLVAALAGLFDLGQTHWLHVGFSFVFWTLGTGALWVLHRASTGLLKRDLERSFELTPLA